MSIKIEVGGWTECSGTLVTLYVDPEDQRVYTFSNVGNGTPMAAFHGRQMSVGRVPLETVPESLEEWIRFHENDFELLMAEYQGTTWDGSNHKGRWTERAAELAFNLDEALQDAFRSDMIETYWDAEEWFSGDPNSVIDAAIETGSISESVEREVSDAAANGARIDPTDAEQALRKMLRQRLDFATPDPDLDKIRELLADE